MPPGPLPLAISSPAREIARQRRRLRRPSSVQNSELSSESSVSSDLNQTPSAPDPDKTERLAQWSATTACTDASRVRSLARARPFFRFFYTSAPWSHLSATPVATPARTHATWMPPVHWSHMSVTQGTGTLRRKIPEALFEN